MKTKNPMSLKGQLKNAAARHNLPGPSVFRMYVIECFLERLALSKYANSFVIKGGFLISALTSVSQRTTMDLDTTFIGKDFDKTHLTDMMKEICAIVGNDDFAFSFQSCEPIRETTNYIGLRAHLTAVYQTIKAPFTIDVTTSDAITPHEMKLDYSRLFEDGKISLLTYPPETVLAEKLEAILTLNVLSTRPRDFYDVFLLSSRLKIDLSVLQEAFKQTAQRRNALGLFKSYGSLLDAMANSVEIIQQWTIYRRNYPYAKDITFESVMTRVQEICRQVIV